MSSINSNLDWEEIHNNRRWGKYPPEELIRFIAKNYYNAENRHKIKILELGCGQGANIWYLAKEGFNTFGIDFSKSAINKAKRYLKEEHLEANLNIGNVEKINYENEYFNCIIDIQCLQCNTIKQIRNILKEVYRLLNSGGKMFSITFSTETYGYGSGDKIEENTFTNVNKQILSGNLHHFFTKEEIVQIYTSIGFKNMKIDYVVRSYGNDKYSSKIWIIEATK
ncbi:class I SAM-dependent methyltransferase [Haloimpatiens sp. FM7330]|uniref:class I SAM-dependent methyltransferase n=1 Tax=Haloimpatiens sp. FM7330 TaxID=3298610 RepID=UPI003629A9C8